MLRTQLHLLTVLLAELGFEGFILLPYLSFTLIDNFIDHLLLDLLSLQVSVFS